MGVGVRELNDDEKKESCSIINDSVRGSIQKPDPIDSIEGQLSVPRCRLGLFITPEVDCKTKILFELSNVYST
jgi:hypothetical protein